MIFILIYNTCVYHDIEDLQYIYIYKYIYYMIYIYIYKLDHVCIHDIRNKHDHVYDLNIFLYLNIYIYMNHWYTASSSTRFG